MGDAGFEGSGKWVWDLREVGQRSLLDANVRASEHGVSQTSGCWHEVVARPKVGPTVGYSA